jgi:hypothetical protein
MNIDLLHEILNDTTIQLRKGAEIEQRMSGPLQVTEVFAMPHESEARPELERVDMEFLIIGVDKARAEARKDDLIAVLRDYPKPSRLADGPSYIEVAPEIGGQGAAFQLFALGKVLGLWDVITPTRLGATGEQARQMAGNGFIMMTGYRI